MIVHTGPSGSFQRRLIDFRQRDLVQFLVRRLFLFQGLVQELCDLLMPTGLSQRTRGPISGNS